MENRGLFAKLLALTPPSLDDQAQTITLRANAGRVLLEQLTTSGVPEYLVSLEISTVENADMFTIGEFGAPAFPKEFEIKVRLE